MSTDPDAGYICSLTEASIKKAQEELHEDPNDRLGPVKQLREWVEQQPHIRFPTDTINLLRLLRVSKGSQLKARSLIENTCKLYQDEPDWFKHHDNESEEMKKMFDYGYLVPLGFTENGEFVVLERLASIDPKLISDRKGKTNFTKMINSAFMYLLRDENVQVNGVHTLVDCTGVTMKHQTIWSISDFKVFARMFKDCTPCRFKSMQMYNSNPVMDSILSIMIPFMPTKLQKRIYIHGNNLESVYKVIPMKLFPEEYLPDDYNGPKNKPLQTLIDEFKKKLSDPTYAAYHREVTSDKYGYDESMKPKMEPEYQASFRKLNVD